ncbi:hypothetical protein BGX31_003459 [Mortierella sp. GBA43]|nr:hypothetical protein BGX31_003459 [Mortierella sp. GBA43]
MALVRLLLRFASAADVTDLLRAAYIEQAENQDDGAENEVRYTDVDQLVDRGDSSTISSGINYLQCLQHFCSPELDSSSSFLFRNRTLQSSNLLTTYLDKSGLLFQYRLRELKLEDNPYLTKHNGPEVTYLSVDLRVQLTWALCSPVLENIQSLVIPLSDMKRYNGVVHRFENLVKVIFKLDRKFSYLPFIEFDLEAFHPMRFSELHRARTEAFEGMIQFVQEHIRLFPRQLQFVSCPPDYNWTGNPQKCPDDYLDQLLNLLPSLSNHRVLDGINWAQFLTKVDVVNLEGVDEIHSPQGDDWCPPLQFLERTPHLKVLDIASISSWTFEEPSKAEAPNPSENSDPTSCFPPLQHVRLKDYDGTTINNELSNLLTRCSNTLRSLTIYGHNNLPISFIRALVQPQSQPMCQLQKLVIILAGGLFTSFPLKALEDCPMLEHLELKDGNSRHTFTGTTLRSQAEMLRLFSNTQLPPSYKSKLRTIRLQGTLALTFQLDTLRHTPALETLYLGTRVTQTGRGCYLRTPCSWNWQLRNLRELHLTGEFAYQFQFSMLAGCPNLESLFLNMTTLDDPVMVVEPEDSETSSLSNRKSISKPKHVHYIGNPPQRHLQLEHSSNPNQRIIQMVDFSGQAGYLSVPKLKYLLLHGRWFLTGDSLLFMFRWVMPNLTVVSESQCSGFSLETWLRATGRLKHLRSALSTRIVSEERLTKLGLERLSPDPESDQDTSPKPELRIRDRVVDGTIQPSLDFVYTKSEPTQPNRGPSINPWRTYSFNHQGWYTKSSSVPN